MTDNTQFGELPDDELERVSGGMGNMLQFQLQNWMSNHHDAQTLASSVAQRYSDTTSSIWDNIG